MCKIWVHVLHGAHTYRLHANEHKNLDPKPSHMATVTKRQYSKSERNLVDSIY